MISLSFSNEFRSGQVPVATYDDSGVSMIKIVQVLDFVLEVCHYLLITLLNLSTISRVYVNCCNYCGALILELGQYAYIVDFSLEYFYIQCLINQYAAIYFLVSAFGWETMYISVSAHCKLLPTFINYHGCWGRRPQQLFKSTFVIGDRLDIPANYSLFDKGLSI